MWLGILTYFNIICVGSKWINQAHSVFWKRVPGIPILRYRCHLWICSFRHYTSFCRLPFMEVLKSLGVTFKIQFRPIFISGEGGWEGGWQVNKGLYEKNLSFIAKASRFESKAVSTRHVSEPIDAVRGLLSVHTGETTSRPGTSGREPFAIGPVRSTLSCGCSTGR